MNRAQKFCRMVHLSEKDPDSDEYKKLVADLALAGPQIKDKLAEIKKKQMALNKEHTALHMEAINLMQSCPHDGGRWPYRAAGVETAVCNYCGDQEHVRDY